MCSININTCVCETYHLFSIKMLIYYKKSFIEVDGDVVHVTVIGISDRTEQNLNLHVCLHPACFISYI